MPHFVGLFVLGMYNPGTITAVVLNIPFSVYLFREVKKEELLKSAEIKKIIFAGLVLYLPVVYLNHVLAHSFVGIFFHS